VQKWVSENAGAKAGEFNTVAEFAEIIVLALFFGASQGVLSVYIPDLFPVDIRGTATGFCFNTGRVLTAIAVLFVGVLVTELGGYGNSLFIFSWVFLIGLVVTFFAPSTEHERQQQQAALQVSQETIKE